MCNGATGDRYGKRGQRGESNNNNRGVGQEPVLCLSMAMHVQMWESSSGQEEVRRFDSKCEVQLRDGQLAITLSPVNQGGTRILIVDLPGCLCTALSSHSFELHSPKQKVRH